VIRVQRGTARTQEEITGEVLTDMLRKAYEVIVSARTSCMTSSSLARIHRKDECRGGLNG
jgi:hypothetical protein